MVVDAVKGRPQQCPAFGCPPRLTPLKELPVEPDYWVRIVDNGRRWSYSGALPQHPEESETDEAYVCDKCRKTFRLVVTV